ncbi:MAG: hypothetical protein U9N80_11585 [Chloroflexota bacterium]|nr:hypothetical protein [Chloroflexota bacterium]
MESVSVVFPGVVNNHISVKVAAEFSGVQPAILAPIVDMWQAG